MENDHITVGSNSYRKVNAFKYLDSFLTNKNTIHGEIESRLKAGISCYYCTQKCFVFSNSFE